MAVTKESGNIDDLWQKFRWLRRHSRSPFLLWAISLQYGWYGIPGANGWLPHVHSQTRRAFFPFETDRRSFVHSSTSEQNKPVEVELIAYDFKTILVFTDRPHNSPLRQDEYSRLQHAAANHLSQAPGANHYRTSTIKSPAEYIRHDLDSHLNSKTSTIGSS